MNKTVTITIQGIVFTIEEQAFKKLDAYLNAIKEQLGNTDEGQEIYNEIESRIVELFQQDILQKRSVITESDIDHLQKIMGDAHTFAEDDQEQSTQKTRKHFYRDGDNKIIAGVAAGIASYLGIDPVIVRVILVICAVSGVFSGLIIVLYALLWLTTDEADTVSEKMQMQGEPVTLKSIEDRVKKTVESGKNMLKDKAKKNETGGNLKRFFNKLFQLFGLVFWNLVNAAKKLLVILSKLLGVVILIAGIMGLAASSFLYGLLTFYPNSSLIDFPLDILGSSLEYYVLVAAASLILLIPFLFFTILGGRIIKKRSIFPFILSISLLVLWVLSIAITALVSVNTIPELQKVLRGDHDIVLKNTEEYEQISKQYETENFTSIDINNDFHVTYQKGEVASITASGAKKDLEEILLETKNNTLSVKRQEKFVFCLFCVKRPIDIAITSPNDLEKIDLSGIAQLDIVTPINQPKLTVDQSGASKLTLEAMTEDLYADLSGVAKLTLKGNTRIANIFLSGATKLNALDFAAENVQADLSGASMMSMEITKSLTVDASGASSIIYKGTPTVKQDLSGAASIKELLQNAAEITSPEIPELPALPQIQEPERQ